MRADGLRDNVPKMSVAEDIVSYTSHRRSGRHQVAFPRLRTSPDPSTPDKHKGGVCGLSQDMAERI